MNEVFMVFLSLSFSGSLVASIFFLLKPLFKNKLSKTWQYYILLVVILRFLVPISSETSLVGMIFNQVAGSNFYNSSPTLTMTEINYAQQAPFVEIPARPEDKGNSPDDLKKNTEQMVMRLLWLGWLVPASFMLLRKFIAYQRSIHAIKAGCIKIDNIHVMDIYREVSKSMNIRYSPNLTQNENIAAPMLVGAIRPAIVLTDICMKDKKLCYILQHELTHYKRLDIIYKWLVQIMVCLHWYNPLVYLICREINQNCELSCDEAVIMRLDETEKYTYGDMLLETINLHKNSPSTVVSVMLNEDAKLIKERLAAIMKFKKISKISRGVSLVLAVFFLCGAIYTGAYAQASGTPTSPISESGYIPVKETSDTVKYDNVPASSKLQFGPYELNTVNTYSLTASWQGGGDTLKLFLAREDGYLKEYTLSNGKTISINVPQNGLYYFYSPRNRETGDMRTLSAQFHKSDALTPAIPDTIPANTQTVVYESVEIRHYEQTSGSIPAHPYIHDIKTNLTNKKIIDHQRGMLAYDKDGKALKIDWYPLDSERDNTFYFLYDWGSTEILPGKTYDVFGGWSLNVYGNDPVASEIAYVLYCDKEITFEDGTVWKNPDFDSWFNTYESKTIDVKVLESYYPYEQTIVF